MTRLFTQEEIEARRQRNKKHGWIGVDFDGTLATYEKWEGPDVLGDPIPLMLERVKKWIAQGYQVRILTARAYGRDAFISIRAIEDWTEKHVGKKLIVTCIKDGDMIELWDDRAIQVIANTGVSVAEELRAERLARQGKP